MKGRVEDEQQTTLPIVESIGDKPYLTPMDAAKLLGVGKTTIYRYMSQGQFKVLRLPARTLVRRSDLEAMFDNAPAYVKRNNRKHRIDSDTYSMKEICEKYKVTRKVAMRRIEHFDIPKIYEGRNVSFSYITLQGNEDSQLFLRMGTPFCSTPQFGSLAVHLFP